MTQHFNKSIDEHNNGILKTMKIDIAKVSVGGGGDVHVGLQAVELLHVIEWV